MNLLGSAPTDIIKAVNEGISFFQNNSIYPLTGDSENQCQGGLKLFWQDVLLNSMLRSSNYKYKQKEQWLQNTANKNVRPPCTSPVHHASLISDG